MNIMGLGVNRTASTVASPWLQAERPATQPSSLTEAPPVSPVEQVLLSAASPTSMGNRAGAALAVSMALLALPSFALAQEAVPAPSSSVSVAVEATPPAKSTKSTHAAQDSSKTTEEDVPWFDSVEKRANDINDGFRGIKGAISSYTEAVNRKLNDHPLAQYRASGELGSYTWKFDPLSMKVDPYVTVRVNRFGVGVRGEMSVARASLEKHDTVGSFTRSQGVRAEIFARAEVGTGTKFDLEGLKGDPNHSGFAGPRIEAFQQLRNDSGSWKQTYEFNVGASHDLTTQTPLAYMRAVQRFENDQVVRPWLGSQSRVRVELEEGIQRNWGTSETSPYYRFFAGAARPIPLSIRGHEGKVDVEAGLQAQGNKDRAVELKPVVRARLHF